MLVITQQEGEILEIGDNVRILIRRVRGGWVRMAIDAPREVVIRRVRVAADAAVAVGDDSDKPEIPPPLTPANVVTRRRRPK